MSSRQIEMTWRCTSCGAKNLGRYKQCQSCRNPKDGSEEYEMPEDPSKAASVTEESLLRMALAGPDWRCAYCGSDQRAPDKGCGNCGASALEGEAVPDAPEPAPPPVPAGPPPTPKDRTRALRRLAVVGLLLFSCLGFSLARDWYRRLPRDYDARVTSVSWDRTVLVERYRAKSFEGFKENLPSDATEVQSLGKRFHHNESVPDGFRTETYSVQVPDGYRTETYTERVSCGQDCTETPRSCSEKCKSNRNGFATCNTVCTGGNRRCSTKYCNQTRSRQVPRTRSETRTRQVQKYKQVPRDAEAFSWVSFVWEPNRTLHAAGRDVTVRWPDTTPRESLGPGEQERAQRTERYEVQLRYGEEQELTLAPTTEAEFVKFAPQSVHQLHSEDGRFKLDGQVVTPMR
jgi:hypothetical protein